MTTIAGAMFASEANAGCSCQCVDGYRRSVCSNPFDIPPICSQLPCPFGRVSTDPNLSPLVGPRPNSCQSVEQCDDYGNCKWRQVCH